MMPAVPRTCPICLQELQPLSPQGYENHKDYCRQRELEEIKAKAKMAEVLPHQFKPLSFDEVAETLGSTVKRDKTTKIILFSAMLLTYTEQEQLNILMAAESSSGKSYLPLELSNYFPPEDVLKLGGASPTSFFHEVSGGDLATWDEEKHVIHVNLSKKILIFLDQPHDLLLQKMRSFLSHDEKEIVYKIANRKQKSGLRTETIILHGFPTWIFCTVKYDMDQQERTRNLQLSPETGPEKVNDAAWLLLERKSNRDAFLTRLVQDEGRMMLLKRVQELKAATIKDVIIPQPLQDEIKRAWTGNHSNMIPRNIRDLDRLLSLMKASALLNFQLRTQETDFRIVANDQDVREATALYGEVAEANELGIAPQVYEIFKECFAKFPSGARKLDILREYHSVFHRPLSTKRLEKEVIPSLEASGLISEEADPENKKYVMYHPHPVGYVSSAKPETKTHTPGGGGTTRTHTPGGGGTTRTHTPGGGGTTGLCETCGGPGMAITRIGESQPVSEITPLGKLDQIDQIDKLTNVTDRQASESPSLKHESESPPSLKHWSSGQNGQTGQGETELSKVRELILEGILPELEKRQGYAAEAQVIYACQEHGTDRELVLDILQSLLKEGTIFQPRQGCYVRTVS